MTDDDATLYAAIMAEIAAASPGDVIFLRKGYWFITDTIDLPASVYMCGANPFSSTITSPVNPADDDPFGVNDTDRPLLRTAATGTNHIGQMCVFFSPATPTGYGAHIRNWGVVKSVRSLRRDVFGFGTYPGQAKFSQSHPQWVFSGTGRIFNWNEVASAYSNQDFSYIEIDGNSGEIDFFHLNCEHLTTDAGSVRKTGTNITHIHSMKCEQNGIIVKATGGTLYMDGFGGNATPYINEDDWASILNDRGAWDSGATYATHDWVTHSGQEYLCVVGSSTGSAPPSSDWKIWHSIGYNGDNNVPSLFNEKRTLYLLQDMDHYRITQTQDQGKFKNQSSLGHGTSPQWTRIINEKMGDFSNYMTDRGARPSWIEGPAPALTIAPDGLSSAPTISEPSATVSSTYDHQVTLGWNNNTQYGYRSGQFGSMVPDTLDTAQVISHWFGNTTNDSVQLRIGAAGNEQITGGITALTVDVEGYGTLSMSWWGGSLYYGASNEAAFVSWLVANNGSTVGVTFNY